MAVFVDATPSEQWGGAPNEALCLVGVLADSAATDLAAYKALRRGRRSTAAVRLANALRNDRTQAIGSVVTMSAMEPFALRLLRELGALEDEGASIVVDEEVLSRPLAIGAAWYAAGITVIAARAAAWAKVLKPTQVTLVIDRPPTDPSGFIRLVGRIAGQGEVGRAWAALRKRATAHLEHDITVDWLHSYTEGDGRERPGKAHPAAILADWLSHSLHACVNSPAVLDGGAGRSEQYREALASPWRALEQSGRAQSATLPEWLVAHQVA